MNKRADISKIIVALAEYYDKILSAQQIAMYVEDLIELEPQELVDAIKRYRNDPKNERFPLPVKLKAMIGAADSPEDAARDASSRIVAAVSRYGWNNPTQARVYIGGLGWEVVRRQGGWLNVCEMLTYSNQGQYQAQWREIALSIQRSGASSFSGPMLPSPDGPGPNNLLSFFKDMPK